MGGELEVNLGGRTNRKFAPAIIATVVPSSTLYGRNEISNALAAARRTITSSSLDNARTIDSNTAVSLIKINLMSGSKKDKNSKYCSKGLQSVQSKWAGGDAITCECNSSCTDEGLSMMQKWKGWRKCDAGIFDEYGWRGLHLKEQLVSLMCWGQAYA